MNYSILFVLALILTFLATVLILRKLIPILKSHKMGQKILRKAHPPWAGSRSSSRRSSSGSPPAW